MTLLNYIEKRNGVPLSSPHSLRNNLHRSLGAKNFSAFWQYWNPIFGYYLGKRVFKPLKNFMPPAPALIGTFLICGLFHDLVTFLVRGHTAFLFAIWFLLMGFMVLFTRILHHDFSNRPWLYRAGINLFIVGGCYFLATRAATYLALGL